MIKRYENLPIFFTGWWIKHLEWTEQVWGKNQLYLIMPNLYLGDSGWIILGKPWFLNRLTWVPWRKHVYSTKIFEVILITKRKRLSSMAYLKTRYIQYVFSQITILMWIILPNPWFRGTPVWNKAMSVRAETYLSHQPHEPSTDSHMERGIPFRSFWDGSEWKSHGFCLWIH